MRNTIANVQRQVDALALRVAAYRAFAQRLRNRPHFWDVRHSVVPR